MFHACRLNGRLFYWVLAVVTAIGVRAAAAPQGGITMTTVSDTVYMADGTGASGTLIISWPAFVTAGGNPVAGGTTNVTLGAGGTLSVALAPNAGANPAGVYYTVVYQLGPGEVKTEYWVVPTTSPTNLATVRTTPGAGTAAQPASMQYVNTVLATKANDSAVVHLAGTETIAGAKVFSTAPSVPAPQNTSDVANKSYVDTAVANVGAGNYLSTAGGTMLGPITLPSNPSAPLQAATKQYVDIGMNAKADLVSGTVPASELGTGAASSTTCLYGNGTWGPCGSGGSGNVSTVPAASQNISQPVGTQFGVNNVNGTRYVSLTPGTFNWSQSVTGSLTGGAQATVTLATCPLGIFGNDTTTYISINGGAEYVQLQGGGTCVPGGANLTVKFTPKNSYTNPTLGSASTGIQEAMMDAQAGGAGTPKANFKVVFQPTNPPTTAYYAINAAVTVPFGIADIDGSGASIDCEATDKCFYFLYGELKVHGFRVASKTTYAGAAITATACGNSPAAGTNTITANNGFVTGQWVDIRKTDNPHYWGIHQVASATGSAFTFVDGNNCGGQTTIAATTTPGGAALEHAFLEDAGNGLTVSDIYFDPPGWGVETLNNGIVVDNDQDFSADNLNWSGNGGVHCDASYCGSAVYAPGPFSVNSALGRITRSQLSMGCQGNGIEWLSGNTLKVSDTVIQGFQQYGIETGSLRGGFGATTTDNVYNEVGGCSNPIMTAAGFTGYAAYNMAGINVMGNTLNANGEGTTGPDLLGQEPQFATGGATNYEYWLVICDGANCSTPMRFGQAAPANSTTYTIGWPRYASQTASVVTYWPLRTTGTGYALTAPYGTGNWSLVTSAVGQCAGFVCTMTDGTSTTLRSYAVGIAPNLTPFVWNWPGSVVLGGGATMYGNDLPVTNLSSVVATSQNSPSVFVQRMGAPTPGVYVTGLAGNSSGNNNAAVGATLLQSGAAVGGGGTGLKGRLNFFFGPAGSPPQGHLITLLDSNPFKTWADGNHRPAYDAADTYIGLDQVGSLSQAGLAIGASLSISNYVGNAGDNLAWGERLTAGLKEFKVASKFDSTVTFAGITGSGSQCLHVSATGVLSGTGSDCGSGSGTGIVNSGVASQVAMYSGTGAAVSGDSALTDNGTTLNYVGSGGISAATGTFSGNLTVNGQLLVAGPWMVSSPIPGTAMAAAGAGTSALGISNDGNFYISANAGTPVKVATAATSSYFSNLFQEDSNDLAEYNGTTPQGLNIYGTRADASDYERLALTYDTVNTGFFKIDAQAAGTGTKRGLAFWVNGAARWGIDQLNMFKPFVDNLYDVGSTAFRVRNGYFGTGLMTPSLTLNGSALSSVIGTPSANLMTAGTVSGTGQPLCTDGTGNLTITTVGCPPGTGTIGGNGATSQLAYWTNTSGLGAAPLYVTNANTVEQYNGTNVQTFNVYGTSNGGNYERLALTYDTVNTSYFKIDAQAGGTGTKRGLAFWVNGAARWGIDQLDMLKPIVDNSYDIGTSSLRVRDLYLARNLTMSGTATTYAGKATAGTGLAPVYGTVSSTGLTAAVASTTACASATCGAGQYVVNYYLDSTVACTTPGSAAAALTIGWTDETNAKTLQVPLSGAGVSGGNSLPLGSTANFGNGSITIWSAGSANITYSTSYTGCTAGTGTYALRIAVRQLQ